MVTTDVLRRMHKERDAELLVPSGLVDVLDPLGLHVLVPNGHIHGEGEHRITCAAQLAVAESAEPTVVGVVVAVETFESLPPTFTVLRAAAALVPACVATVDEELAGLGADQEGP